MDGNDKDINILGSNYEKSLDRKERKKDGAFYTPSSIIDYILKYTMENLNVLKNPFVKVLDPSCGCGYFLIEAYKYLFSNFYINSEKLRSDFSKELYIIKNSDCEKTVYGDEYWKVENLKYHILKNCIYGADIDPEAVRITSSNLDANIICCNSLIKWNEGCSNGHTELSEIYEFWNRKYDYIIGNPPWVSLSRKFKNGIEKNLMDYYIETYHGDRYLPNLYEYFIKRSFEVLNKNGRLGFIIPDRFASNLQYADMRRYILHNYNIIRLAFSVEFPGINTDTMIFMAENSYNCDNKFIVDINNARSYNVKQTEYIKNPNMEFSYEIRTANKSIKNTIECNSYKLSDICITFTGFIGIKEKITATRVDKSQIEILKGNNIQKYRVLHNYYYEFIDSNIKGGTKNIEKLTCKNKIVVRKTGGTIIAALDERGYAIEQSLYGIIPKNKNITSEYILGLLNSKLVQWYYVNFLITNSNSMPQIKKYNLDRIPVRRCSEGEKLKIKNLVCRIIQADSESKKMKFQSELNNAVFNIYGIDEKGKNIIEEMINER